MGFLGGLIGPILGGLFGGIGQSQQNNQNNQNAIQAQNNAFSLNQQGLQNALQSILGLYNSNPDPALSMENISAPPQYGGQLGGGELGANGLPLALQAPHPVGQVDPGQLIKMLTGGAPPPQSRVSSLPGQKKAGPPAMNGKPVYSGEPIPGPRLGPILNPGGDGRIGSNPGARETIF